MAQPITFSEVVELVKKIIVKELNVDASDVRPDASIQDDLGADSLARIELVMAFEDDLSKGKPEHEQVSISDEEATKVKTVQDACILMADKLGLEVPAEQQAQQEIQTTQIA